MGVVYRGQDLLLQREIAIKILNDTMLSESGRARLLNEARLVAQLSHPNIVQIFDAGQADGMPFLVMELIEGSTLRDHPPRTIEEIVHIAHQICQALEHAHQRGIIHRDLKPENVLLAPDFSVKLMDFGLARSTATRLTQEGTLVGTVYYLAPEQAIGGEIDGRTDLYALGAMLYEFSTGRTPFLSDDPFTIITQHLYAPVVPPGLLNPAIPAWLDGLIVRLLGKRLENRPASAREVIQALEQTDAAPGAQATVGEGSLLERIVRGRLIGRERELAELVAAWQRAVACEGQVILISGEPGIGKTRLARELLTRAEVSGGIALTGECHTETGAPYAPFATILRAGLSAAPELQISQYILADLLVLAPDLYRIYSEIPRNPQLDPQSERQRLFESAAEFFLTLSARQPVLIFIDDLHWADSASLLLFHHLARRLARSKVLLAGTYREIELEQTSQLNDLLLNLNRERLAMRVKLARLDRQQTKTLLAAMFAEEITTEFLDSIFKETEGNPFFVEEVCKSLIESGKVYFADGRWQLGSIADLEIPQSVRLAIQSRVNKLPPATREALVMAAILGREFDFDILLSASALDEDDLLAALEFAGKAQLVNEVRGKGGEIYTFAHALIPSTLREEISGRRQRRLHERAALAIQAIQPDNYEALAIHYSAADDVDQAIMNYQKAAGRALSVLAYDSARADLRAALDLLEPGEQTDTRFTLLEDLADVHALLRQGAQAIALYQEALEILPQTVDYARVSTLRFHRKIVDAGLRIIQYADRQLIKDAVEKSLSAGRSLIDQSTWAESQPDKIESVNFLVAAVDAAWIDHPHPDWGAAAGLAQRAVEIAETQNAPITLASALKALALTSLSLGRFREALALALRQLAILQEAGVANPRESWLSHMSVATGFLSVGEFTRAIEHAQQAEKMAIQAQDLRTQASSIRLQGECYYFLDRWEQVLALVERYRLIEARAPDFLQRTGAMCFLIALEASIYAHRGAAERASALRQESIRMMIAQEGPMETWNRSNYF